MKFNMFQARSLKTRVTFFTLTIFLISIWSLLFYAKQMLRTDMEHMLGEQQFSSVSYLAAEINQDIDDRLRALEKVAERISPLTLSNSALIQSFLENCPEFVSMFNSGVYVTRRDGIAIADFPTVKGRIGTNYIDREWVPEALKGKSAIGKPVMGRTLHAPIFVMATPVRDTEGKVIGVLMGANDLSKPNFLDRIANAHYGKTGGFLLIAPHHNLFVTATDKSRIMQPLPAPGINLMHDRYMRGFDGFGIAVNSRGIEELSATKHIPSAGWFLKSVIPTKDAFAPIHNMNNRMILAAIFLTLLAGGLTWWMLKRQLTPMLDAAATLAIFSNTDQLPEPLPITSQDEVGQLISGFNTLLENLSQREESLLAIKDRLQKQNIKLQLSEEQSRNNALLLQSVIEHFPGVVFWKNTDLVYLGCNRAFSDAAGLAHPEEIVGKSDYDMPWAETEASHYRDTDRQVIDSGEATLHIIETQLQANGQTAWFDTCKIPLRDSNGTVFGVLGASFDVTMIKMAEEERHKLEEQLHQSRKIEAVGRLAGGVAHDFNNMLGVIIGHAELSLMKMEPSQPAYASLTEIRTAAERSADLTRQLLAFARKQTIAPKVIDLNEIVSGMLKMLQRLIGEDMHLTWEPAPDLWQVKVDPSQIDQILANLCVNARDAVTDIGRIRLESGNITIDAHFESTHAYVVPGEYVRLMVSDEGGGMDKETVSHIFEPFYTTKELGKGTGLGLATVYGIVKQNNGFINVYSEPGQGTTFSIYLPRHRGENETAQKESVGETVPCGSETILLVEDEPTVLKLASMMLEGLGYTVLTAATAEEAIRLSREYAGTIHLLLTDVVMPNMNGRALSNELLSLSPQLKCLFMSGYTADIIAQRGVLDEGMYFIQKPFSRPDLAAKVREVLDSNF